MNIFEWLYRTKEEEPATLAAIDVNGSFTLKIGDLIIGYLSMEDHFWCFHYSDEFKNQNKYRRLVGFSDIDKIYKNETLWPFFKIRIPGLKQPLIREIIMEEDIDIKDEVSLLRRFGRRNVSNPYILEPI